VDQNGTIFVHIIISPNNNRFFKFFSLSESGGKDTVSVYYRKRRQCREKRLTWKCVLIYIVTWRWPHST